MKTCVKRGLVHRWVVRLLLSSCVCAFFLMQLLLKLSFAFEFFSSPPPSTQRTPQNQIAVPSHWKGIAWVVAFNEKRICDYCSECIRSERSRCQLCHPLQIGVNHLKAERMILDILNQVFVSADDDDSVSHLLSFLIHIPGAWKLGEK